MKSGTVLLAALLPACLSAQIATPWGGYANNPQHTAVSAAGAQPLDSIHWSTPVDLNPPGGGAGDLLIHYGSISVTAGNTVFVPVKTGFSDGFEVKAFDGLSGTLRYTLPSDYSLPSHSWTPSYGPVLSLGTRLYYPGAGGAVYYRNSPDSARGPNGSPGSTGQFVFYGKSVYAANASALNAAIRISTPITADRYGDIFFGFVAAAGNPVGLVSGVARIGPTGIGTWVSATSLAGNDPAIAQVTLNCAPALSNDHKTVYVAVSGGAEFDTGYLVSFNAATLAPVAHARLYDPRGGDATVSSDSSAAPMVGPDGDVYYGVLEYNCCGSHNDRGWMLHFDSTLSTVKTPGSFGWDNTASVVPAGAVPGYQGTSSYLILTKYNNYAGVGTGDGVNKVAVLDPEATMQDEYSAAPVTVMKEVMTVTGATPDPVPASPGAVYEWCINSAAIDPVTKAAIVNSEDGVLYRWDFTSGTLLQRLRLTSGRGEAYTPTAIGPDGTVYAINDAILFAVGS